MARARKASVVQSKICMLVYGDKFTGKSSFALESMYLKRPDGKPFRVLYLDPESGSIDDYLDDLENNGINLDNLYIVYTQSLGEVRSYIKKAKNNEPFYELDENGDETDKIVLDGDGEQFAPDMIVVDGATILNLTTKQGLVDFSRKRAEIKARKSGLLGDEKLVRVEGAGLELKDYQTINFRGQDFVLDLAASGKHYIITAREVDEMTTKIVKDPMTGREKDTRIPTGKKLPDGFKGMDYNVKTYARMYRNEDNAVCMFVQKDRAHIHDDCAIIVDPTLLDWQAVIDKTASNPNYIIQNDLTNAVNIEQAIYEKELLGTQPVGEFRPENPNEVSDIGTEIKSEIKVKLSSLSAPIKKIAKDKIKAEGLEINYSKIDDLEDLKKFQAIINSFIS